MRYRILPYRQGSKSAKALSTELNGKVLKLVRLEPFKPKLGDVVVNWGATTDVGVLMGGCKILNYPHSIKCATNKLNFFVKMGQEAHDILPRFWTNKNDIPEEAFPIVCRTVLAGHSGDGIVIANSRDDVVDCPLYVEYKKKKEEYRIHVGGRKSAEGYASEVFSVQRKARRLDTPSEQVNWQVRNHSNGFVYVREGVDPPQAVTEAAKRSLEVVGLDFGAVDIIWNEKEEKPYVLEINTAPGLEGQTVKDYADFFRSL